MDDNDLRTNGTDSTAAARSAKGDFSKGRVPFLILRLGLPIMLAEMVVVLYNIVDRAYIGHMGDTSTYAITGLGVCFPLITFISGFANLCSTGGTTLATIARGEKNDEKAERMMSTSFTLLLLIGTFLTVVLFTIAPWLLELLGGDEYSLPYAVGYFRIYVIGTIPVLISLGMNPFINAQGFPKIGMSTVILGALLNIALDPLFIFALDMGIRGAALATVLSQSASALWVVLFLRSKKPPLRLRHLLIDRAQIGGLIKLGATGFTFRVTSSFTQAIVNIMLKAWGGPLSTLYIGAMSLNNSIREVMSLPNSGITAAGQNVMSYNYGAKKSKRVSECINFIFFCGLLVNTVMWVMMLFFPRPVIRIFTDDPELIDLTVHCARIFFGAFPFMALQMSGQTTFVALNYPKHALFFSMLRKILLVTPLTLLLPNIGLGVDGVFWAEFVSQMVGASICFTTMCLTIWRKVRVGKDMPKTDPAS
ncbi:MAG: MATE family efflux transporter [Clostridiales bacterium]|nr:MATE family efflux transporter [Clostridiales bacterium]